MPLTRDKLLLSDEGIDEFCGDLVSQPSGIILNDFMRRYCNASAKHALEQVMEDMERFSWTTPYISLNEQIAGKEPTLYREFKVQESYWQSLKQLVEEL